MRIRAASVALLISHKGRRTAPSRTLSTGKTEKTAYTAWGPEQCKTFVPVKMEWLRDSVTGLRPARSQLRPRPVRQASCGAADVLGVL